MSLNAIINIVSDGSLVMEKITKFIKANKDVLFCFLGSKVLFAAVLLITRTPYGEALSLFDAVHYRNIASMGYYVDGVTVFFPVIPILIRYIGDAGLVIVNQAAYLTALYFLKQILLKIRGNRNVSTVLAVVAVSPLALFTSLEYTEALFFMLTIIAFYLFVSDRLPLVMGLVLGLSVATRNTGSLLFFAIFIGMCVRMIRDKKIGKGIRDIILCFVPASAISLIYPVFLQIRFGNWKVFMDAQYSYWVRIRSDVIRTTIISLKVIFTDTYKFDGAIDTIVLFKINEALSVLLMLLVITLCVREIVIMKKTGKMNVSSLVCVVYSLLFIFALGLTIRDPMIDCPTDSFYRYYFSLFPMYLGLSRLNEKLCQISMIVCLVITMITAPLFCMGSFFS